MLTVGYVTSAATHKLSNQSSDYTKQFTEDTPDENVCDQVEAIHELINQYGSHPSQFTEERSNKNSYDQGEAMEDTAPLSLNDGEQEEVEEEQALLYVHYLIST